MPLKSASETRGRCEVMYLLFVCAKKEKEKKKKHGMCLFRYKLSGAVLGSVLTAAFLY